MDSEKTVRLTVGEMKKIKEEYENKKTIVCSCCGEVSRVKEKDQVICDTCVDNAMKIEHWGKQYIPPRKRKNRI